MQAGIRYTERHCALRWPLLAWGLVIPAGLMLTGVVLGISVDPAWLVTVPFVPLFGPFLVFCSLLYRNWPTGIRFDDEGLHIGAIGSRRAARRRPTVTHQNWGLSTCPWPGIHTLTVVTDPKELRRLSRSPDLFTLSNRWGKPRTVTACQIGVLSAPFMCAALLVEITPSQARIPDFRPASFFPNEAGRPIRVGLGARTSPTWLIPTRHPERLRRVLDDHQAGGAPLDARREPR